MDAIALISFLGHSSIYPPFDEFLLTHGIKKRPKKFESTSWISDDEAGFTLEFSMAESFDERSIVPRKSDGRFILSAIIIYGRFKEALPYGISLDQSSQELAQRLGKPLEEQHHSGADNATYFKDGILFTVNWKKKSKDSFINFSLPNIYDRENFNL